MNTIIAYNNLLLYPNLAEEIGGRMKIKFNLLMDFIYWDWREEGRRKRTLVRLNKNGESVRGKQRCRHLGVLSGYGYSNLIGIYIVGAEYKGIQRKRVNWNLELRNNANAVREIPLQTPCLNVVESAGEEGWEGGWEEDCAGKKRNVRENSLCKEWDWFRVR